MKLFKLTNKVNRGYDTYDSCVVAADTPSGAVMMHPNECVENWDGQDGGYTWCRFDEVEYEYIGEAKEGTLKGIIIASFNAG